VKVAEKLGGGWVAMLDFVVVELLAVLKADERAVQSVWIPVVE